MKVKATYKSLNPFHVNIDMLSYSKTVDVPDDTDMTELEEFAKEDTRNGYRFEKLEKL